MVDRLGALGAKIGESLGYRPAVDIPLNVSFCMPWLGCAM
jgi:hypothetical protein